MRRFFRTAGAGAVFAVILIVGGCGDKKPKVEQAAISADTAVTVALDTAAVVDTAVISPLLSQFMLDGYSILDTVSGDLNLDQYMDMIMVLKKDGEDSTSSVIDHPERRPLFILIGQADKTYKLAARNDNTVLCVDCGGMMGDPFMQVVIKKGYFSIEHNGGSSWRWTRIVTFKYSPPDNYWYLHKDGEENFHASEPESTMTTNVRTAKDFGIVRFNEFDIYKEDK